MKQKQLAIIIISALSLFSIHLSVAAQTKKYREHQVVQVPGGQKVEILSCRGEGDNEECEVIYYSTQRQKGSRVRESANKIRVAEKEFRDSVIASYYQPPTFKKTDKKGVKSVTVDKRTGSKVPVVNNTLKNKTNKTEIEKDKVFKLKTDSSSLKNATSAKKTVVNSDTIQTSGEDALANQPITIDSVSTNTTLDSSLNKSVATTDRESIKKLSVFIDCNANCDMNYIRTDLTIVDFLLDMNAADVHVLINAQPTGGGGSSIQMIFYGQNNYKRIPDTLIVNIPPNSTKYERRAEMSKGIKRGLVPFLLKTGYAKYIDVNINVPEQKRSEARNATKDPWDYWVVTIGASGTFSSDQVYKSTIGNGYFLINRTTDKLKIAFNASGDYNKYQYSYYDNGTSLNYEVLNKDVLFQHSLVASLGSHWGLGYQAAYSNNTFANNKRRLYGKAGIEFSIFPYKDVNTRFFTISYGLDVRANTYYDTTIYFKTAETLFGQIAQANIAFNQKWGTFSSTISYNSFFKDPALNNLSANVNFNIRITGGLSFYVYATGARVYDQVYLVKGKASEQDVLTRRRQLASEYNFSSGAGLNFRFGSKLNNFVNPRMAGF